MVRMLTNRLKFTVGFIILFVGLEVHSRPHLAVAAKSEQTLSQGLQPSQCPSAKILTDNDYQVWANNLNRHDRPLWLEVGPIRFENEDPGLAHAIVQLVSKTNADYLDFRKGQETLLLAQLKKAASCKKAMCVAKKIFGERVGPRMLYLYVNFRFNSSPIRYPNASLMTVSEIDDVITALRDLPEFFFPAFYNRQLIRFKRGFTEGESNREDGVEVFSNSAIKLFDPWQQLDSFDRRLSVAHELAHLLAFTLKTNQALDRQQAWLTASLWTDKGPYYESNEKIETFVTDYARESPWEDFAESFSYYRYAPQHLLAVSPARYKYLKQYVFSGVEYLKACPKSSSEK